MRSFYLILLSVFLTLGSKANSTNNPYHMGGETRIATFGGGCFWCTEAVFERVKGVQKVVSGFSGGHVKNPSYREVVTGKTGHAEVVQVHFDPSVVTYRELLEILFATHDPTTLNRQGADVGTQYRSAIFFHSPEQEKLAKEYIRELEDGNAFKDPIVTEVTAFEAFYEAEDYHQEYYENNRNAPYCNFMIGPKLKKFEKEFGSKIKIE